MSIDPTELGGGPPPDPTGQGGSPPPDPKDAEIAKLRDQLSDSEGRNAKLREERRNDRATALGSELKLDQPTVDLLKELPADQMEARAKAIAEARGAPPPTPPPTDPAPAQPQEGQQPPATPPPSDPNVEQMGRGGDGSPAPVVTDATADLQTRLKNAKSTEEMQAIQDELKAKERERNRV